MMNICILGLSRSGKSCYLYASSFVLSQGVKSNGCNFSILSTNEQQSIRLNRGIEELGAGWWPKGSSETETFPFEFMIDGQPQFPFTIYDYRGGALDDLTDAGQDERESLYEVINKSKSIIFIVDGCTLKDALDPSLIQEEYEHQFSQIAARNRINYMEMLVNQCRRRSSLNIPVLLVITKRDIFTNDELQAGIELLKEKLPTLFSRRNNLVVGITSVSLGQDLRAGEVTPNGKKQLAGKFDLNISQNLHIPILFALFQDIEEGSESYRFLKSLFVPPAIYLYKNGEEVIIL